MKKDTINILLVEDNPADALLVRECLLNAESIKFNLEHVEHLGNAKFKLGKEDFDVILLDLTLPDSQGIESVKRIVEIAPHLPVIALTGVNDDGISIKALQAGAEDYLVKDKTDCYLLTRSIRYAIERKRLETLLRISEERYRTFFENTKDIFYRTDIKGIINYISPSVKNYGYSVEEVIGKDVRLFYDNPAQRDVLIQLLMENKSVYDFELELRRKDGSKVYVSASSILVLDSEGNPLYIDGILRDITDRKKAEQVLQQSEEKLKTIIENTIDVIYTYNVDGTITFISPNVKQYGYTQEDIIGHNVLEFIHPDDREKVRNDFSKVLETGEECITEARLFSKTGEIIYAEEISKITWIEGKPFQLTGIIRNVTDRKKAEEALRESESKFRAIAESSAAAVFIYKGEKFIYVNKASETLTGYTADELLGMTFWNVVHPDFQQLVKERGLARQQKKSVPQRYEFKIVTKQGEERWVDFSANVIQFDGGLAAVGMAFDITARKRAEEALKESERRYSDLYENAPDMYFSVEPENCTIVFCNETMAKVTGYKKEELIGKPIFELYHPDSHQDYEKCLEMFKETGKVTNVEMKVLTKDGKTIDVMLSASAVRDKNGTILYSRSVWRDITERKRSEQQLNLQSSALEAAANVIVITDRDGNIQWVNSAFTKLTGYSFEEVIGKNPRILKSGKHDEKFYKNLWDTILAGKVWRGEFYNKKKNGDLYLESASISPVKDSNGNITHFIGVKEDITEKKSLESQLLQSQRLESLGTLAGGIAHDFNNILAIIMGHASLLRAGKNLSDRVTSSIDAILTATQRGTGLVKQMLTFARQSEVVIEPVDVNGEINHLIKLLKGTFPKILELKVELTPSIPFIMADRTQLYQALLNLCVNARDAILDYKGGGSITITTGIISGSDLRKKFQMAVENVYVCISIADDGIGMDEVTKQRIFEPFFSTKGKGKGTGLGLAVVYGVVKKFNGFIDVQSTQNVGTTFNLYFPVPRERFLNNGKEHNTSESIPGGTETLLVVEDEHVLLDLLKDVFVKHGYKVITAGDGLEAIDLYKKHQNEIALVFSDFGLPKLQGDKMFEFLKKINPNVRGIIASGFLEPEKKKYLKVLGVSEIVSKPFQFSEILKTIRNVLDSKVI